jgi:protein-L-isoaspartate(D-aspartate) O-methyltransferase
MDRQEELHIIRQAYAKQIMAAAGVDDPRLESAFATVRREDFLGPGPWPIFRGAPGIVRTPNADPVYLYTDQVVPILPEQHINNGQPSLHATLIAAAAVKAGDHVVHVGAGTGYYTAILAQLAGPSGMVTAVEINGELAVRAVTNLAAYPTVHVLQTDGTEAAFDPANVIYVSAGFTGPAEAWLDGLLDGGRLILPLTSDPTSWACDPGNIDPVKLAKMFQGGAVFCVTHQGTDFNVKWVCPAAFVSGAGAGRDSKSEAALAAALGRRTSRKVMRLYRNEDIPEDRCWLRGPGWCFAYE